MDIEIIEMAERKAKFLLRNSSPAMANALRRTMLSDIPKMAIDRVEFHLGPIMVDDKEYESITPLFDEIIAHRLGMVPVPTDYTLFTYQDECPCGGVGCPSCTIMYSLNKIGPCTVLSGDLMPLGNPELKVKDEFVPIVELADGQAVLIYCIALMGTAKKHVKWQVANGVGYKYMPVVSVDPEKASSPAALRCAEICPKKVFEVENGKLTAKRPLDCSLCMTCIEESEGSGVTVEGSEKDFVFKFETDGSLTAQQCLDKTLEILSSKASGFKMQIEEI